MKKKLFKNKVQMVIYIILFIVCIGLFIYVGNIDFSKNAETDAHKMANLYDLVPQDNVYTFADASDALNILSGRSGIVLFGFPENIWTNYTAKYLNEVAKELKIDKIYYYDFLRDREENNGTYETVLNKLEGYVPIFDKNHKDIQAPTILVVKKGKIIAYIDDTSIMKLNISPKDYYTDYQINITKDAIKRALYEYL